MNIAELEGGMIIFYESKEQYSFKPNQELCRYKKFLILNCSLADAEKNYKAIKKASAFIECSSLCAGMPIREMF